ncbi:MAG: polysaccharide biosynthesis C-terminal domain-containing protein [Alphaproteobacteria bacterium]|nr:polysaccharide biosynthesis C-terminal domain-containing protein [Alphaproteobacteria bacterium]
MLLISGIDTTIVGIFNFREIAPYGVAITAVSFLAGIVQAMMAPLTQVFARLHARGETGSIVTTLHTTSFASTALLFAMALWLIALARPIFDIWVGPSIAAQAVPLFDVLLVAIAIRYSATSFTNYLVATGQQRKVMVTPVIEGLTNLIASVVGAYFLGALGVALGTLIGSLAGIGANCFHNFPRTLPRPSMRNDLIGSNLIKPVLCAVPLVAATALPLAVVLPAAAQGAIMLAATALTAVLVYREAARMRSRGPGEHSSRIRDDVACVIPAEGVLCSPSTIGAPELLSRIRQGLVVALGRNVTFNADGLIAFHGADFLSDPRFLHAYAEGMARCDGPVQLQWRVRVAIWAAQLGAKLNGDFVECGVNTGIFAGAIMDYLSFEKLTDRRFFLLDTFEGIPEAGLGADSKSSLEYRNSQYRNVYDVVRSYFSKYPNAVIVRGIIPATLPQVASERIAYLSIDMNVPEPEIAAGEYFWPKLVPGAPILLDDYNYRGFETQRAAWNAFAKRVGVDILPLPTGQGLLIKPPAAP